MKVVCVSDTHCVIHRDLPEGDVLIHAGDLSLGGEPHEIAKALAWLRKQPHKWKFVIGGNHDNALAELPVLFDEQWKPYKDLTPLIYLQGSRYVLRHEEKDYIVFGSPAIPFNNMFRTGARAFMLDATTARHWGYAPNADILITHGPPAGVGDSYARYGDPCLKAYVQQTKPKLHVFGHVHVGRGIYKDVPECPNTLFVNAAQLDEGYRPAAEPFVVEI